MIAIDNYSVWLDLVLRQKHFVYFYLESGQVDDFQRWKSMTRYMRTIQMMGTAKDVMKKIRWKASRPVSLKTQTVVSKKNVFTVLKALQ